MSLKEQIRERAQELGFDDCGFASAGAPPHAAKLEEWLNAGKHGEMAWLPRNAGKRMDPELVLAGVKTVVALVVNYNIDKEEPKDGNKGEGQNGGGSAKVLASSPQASPPLGEEREKTQSEPQIKSFHSSPGASPYRADRPVIARYARFDDYHDILGERLKQLTAFVQEKAPESRSLWYVDTGPILEREFAQRAGLGFAGKHTNLISRKFGNWIFLAEILTTLELEPDKAEKNHCGSCERCITACPTEAITGPFQLDARRCISYLTIELKGSIPVEFRAAIGQRIYGCDDCLAVCPWNRFAKEAGLMKERFRPDLGTPDLLELLELDEEAFRARFAGSPILRTKRRGLLRNVCVALGNGGDARALVTLEKAARDKEPLIAEHALWAMERIEERCVKKTLSTEGGV